MSFPERVRLIFCTATRDNNKCLVRFSFNCMPSSFAARERAIFPSAAAFPCTGRSSLIAPKAAIDFEARLALGDSRLLQARQFLSLKALNKRLRRIITSNQDVHRDVRSRETTQSGRGTRSSRFPRDDRHFYPAMMDSTRHFLFGRGSRKVDFARSDARANGN